MSPPKLTNFLGLGHHFPYAGRGHHHLVNQPGQPALMAPCVYKQNAVMMRTDIRNTVRVHAMLPKRSLETGKCSIDLRKESDAGLLHGSAA